MHPISWKLNKMYNLLEGNLGVVTPTKNPTLAEYVYTPAPDGYRYINYESFVRTLYPMVEEYYPKLEKGFTELYTSEWLYDIDVKIVNGMPTKWDELQIGDIVLFADDNEWACAENDWCGSAMIIKHAPGYDDGYETWCVGYCTYDTQYQQFPLPDLCSVMRNSSAKNPYGNKRILKVRRAIQPKGYTPSGIVTESNPKRDIYWVQLQCNAVMDYTKYYDEDGNRIYDLAVDGIWRPELETFLRSYVKKMKMEGYTAYDGTYVDDDMKWLLAWWKFKPTAVPTK